MSVLRLVEELNEETAEALEWLAHRARNERGGRRVRSVCVWVLDEDGNEAALFTGLYRVNRGKAMIAAMRMQQHLATRGDIVFGQF